MNIIPSRPLRDEIARGLTAAKYAGHYSGSVDGKAFHMIRNRYRRGAWDLSIGGVFVGQVTEPDTGTIHDGD